MSVAQTDSLPHTFPSLFPLSLMHSHAVSIPLLSSPGTPVESSPPSLSPTLICFSSALVSVAQTVSQTDSCKLSLPRTFPSLLSTFSLSLSGSRSFFLSFSSIFFSLHLNSFTFRLSCPVSHHSFSLPRTFPSLLPSFHSVPRVSVCFCCSRRQVASV